MPARDTAIAFLLLGTLAVGGATSAQAQAAKNSDARSGVPRVPAVPDPRQHISSTGMPDAGEMAALRKAKEQQAAVNTQREEKATPTASQAKEEEPKTAVSGTKPMVRKDGNAEFVTSSTNDIPEQQQTKKAEEKKAAKKTKIEADTPATKGKKGGKKGVKMVPNPEAALSAPSESFEQNVEKHMPDINDPAIKAQVQCSACAAVSSELHQRFAKVNRAAKAKGYKHAKDYEFVDVMDQTCKEINNEWGFRVDTAKEVIHPEYVPRGAAKYHIRSGWVSSTVRDKCAQITDDYDEKLFKLGRRDNKSAKDWAEFICVVLDKSCGIIGEKGSAVNEEVPLGEPVSGEVDAEL